MVIEFQPQSRCLTVAEAVQLLRVCPATVFNLINKGELPRVKVGRRTFLRREDVERLLTPQAAAK